MIQAFAIATVTAATLLAAPSRAAAALVGPAPADTVDLVPFEPGFRVDTLPSGVVAYVRPNAEPANRAELRLVVDVGSVHERDDERGLAHFLEHLLFRGTGRFPGSEVTDFLERLGMRFGPDVNASTSFDETVYLLQVPTEDPATLDRAVDLLRDWATRATLSDSAIDAERGVVVEEWRLRELNAGGRIREATIPTILGDSRYAERLPIGDPDVLRGAPAERIRAFYRRWYRPERMAVVAVGDFDAERMRARIRERFEAVPVAGAEGAAGPLDVPRHDATRFAVVTDPEVTATSVTILRKRPHRPILTTDAFRAGLVEDLFLTMLDARFAEIALDPEAPFVGASASISPIVRGVESAAVGALVKEGRLAEGLERIATEVERARRHGFGAGELDRAGRHVIEAARRALAERENRDSAVWAGLATRHYLTGQPVADPAWSHATTGRLVPTIELAEVDDLAASLLEPENRVVLAVAPDKPDLESPGEAELRAALDAVGSASLEPWVDELADTALVEDPPEPVEVVSRSTDAELGITEVELANGVRLVLKPTDFREDEILMAAVSPGGASLVEDEAVPEAATIADVVVASGLASFDATTLDKLLAGRTVSVRASIDELSEGLRGRASPQELETMLQLVHLFVTAPRADSTGLAIVQEAHRALLENRSLAPLSALDDTLRVARWGPTIRRGPIPLDEIAGLDLELGRRIYAERFGDVGDFVFVFVGSFEVDSLIGLARRYLGGLPSAGRRESWRDVAADPPTTVVEKVVRKGREERSQVQLLFTGPLEPTLENRARLHTLEDVLSIVVREELRERRGGIYAAFVGSSLTALPDSTYSIGIGFGADPGRVDELVEALFGEIERLAAEGPGEELLAKAREQELRGYEEGLEQNGFWLEALASLVLQPGRDPREILRYDEAIRGLGREDIRQAAAGLLPDDRYILVVLHPEDG